MPAPRKAFDVIFRTMQQRCAEMGTQVKQGEGHYLVIDRGKT